MGGNAFTLNTPRMPYEVYTAAKARCHSILKQFYDVVGTPIEGPQKTSYGDIDFLVAEPQQHICSNEGKNPDLAKALGAIETIGGGATQSLAIPWPNQPLETHTNHKAPPSLPSDSSASETNEKVPPADEEARYIQIDIHICPDLTSWRWEMFHQAHGDLWNILGTTIRPFGLTINSTGMYLRIEEIEARDRKQSMVFLTSDPMRILDFLHLDQNAYGDVFGDQTDADGPAKRGFKRAWRMFEYAASCRLFFVQRDVEEGDPTLLNGNTASTSGPPSTVITASATTEQTKKALKHNDRKRLAQRPIYRRWIEEFLPHARCTADIYPSTGPTRETVKEDAFSYFGELVKDEYEMRLKSWRRTQQRDEIWRVVIKGNVPTEDVDPQLRTAAIKGLKGLIFGEKGEEGGAGDKMFVNDEGMFRIDVVETFVRDKWREIGELEFAKQQVRAKEAMVRKKEKEKAVLGNVE